MMFSLGFYLLFFILFIRLKKLISPFRLPRGFFFFNCESNTECSLLSFVHLFATPWAVARQISLPMEFSRQKYWSGLPFPSPGDLPDPGIKPVSFASPELAGRFLTVVPPGKPAYSRLINSKLVNAY